MEYSVHNDKIVIRTPFSKKYDLVQIMHGFLTPDRKPTFTNAPLDFEAAGLVRKECTDIWHMDVVLSYATDEATPLMIGGGDIGANHGYPVLVKAVFDESPLARKDSVWQDDGGHLWKLMQRTQDGALFLSEMQPGSLRVSSFRDKVLGNLSSADGQLTVLAQENQIDLRPAVRHESLTKSFDEQTQSLTLKETYTILHPGYYAPKTTVTSPDLVRVENTYRFESDGRLNLSFTYRSLDNAPLLMTEILGTMYQEKCDLGGGNWRVIPGIKPFATKCLNGKEETLDFSKELNTSSDIYPGRYVHLTKDYWKNENEPISKQIDYLKNSCGDTVCGFEAGFESRPRPVTSAWTIVPSRKTYPVFADNVTLEKGEALSGTAYRFYFPADK